MGTVLNLDASVVIGDSCFVGDAGAFGASLAGGAAGIFNRNEGDMTRRIRPTC